MIDWNEVGQQIQPGIINFLNAALGVATIALGGIGVWLGIVFAKKKQAETALTQLQHAKEIAEVSVKAVEQNPDIQTNEAKKASALEAVNATVPKLGDHLHDKLVEAAVKDLRKEDSP